MGVNLIYFYDLYLNNERRKYNSIKHEITRSTNCSISIIFSKKFMFVSFQRNMLLSWNITNLHDKKQLKHKSEVNYEYTSELHSSMYCHNNKISIVSVKKTFSLLKNNIGLPKHAHYFKHKNIFKIQKDRKCRKKNVELWYCYAEVELIFLQFHMHYEYVSHAYIWNRHYHSLASFVAKFFFWKKKQRHCQCSSMPLFVAILLHAQYYHCQLIFECESSVSLRMNLQRYWIRP